MFVDVLGDCGMHLGGGGWARILNHRKNYGRGVWGRGWCGRVQGAAVPAEQSTFETGVRYTYIQDDQKSMCT